MIGAEEPPDSQPPGCQEDGVQELPDGTPHHLQHGRELRRDQCLSCGGGIGVVQYDDGTLSDIVRKTNQSTSRS